MKFMLVVLITMGLSGEKPQTIEMRIPQENRDECLKSANTFRFTLPLPSVTFSVDTRCEPRKINEKPELRGTKT